MVKQVDDTELFNFMAAGGTLIGRDTNGEEYIGATADYYLKPKIDGKKIKDVQDNFFVAQGLQDLAEKLFTADPQIHYYDANDKEDAKLNRELERIMSDCELDARIRQSFNDTFNWGPYLYQPTWGRTEDGWYAPTNIKRLPPESFINPPEGVEGYIYSEILKGICKNAKGETEFWQLQTDGKSHLLKDVVMLKNPTSPELAGKSRLIPVIPMVTLISFFIKAYHQNINRTGAPAIFIKFKSAPKVLGGTDEIALAKLILQNWGKDNSYMLTDNMDIVELKNPSSSTARDGIILIDMFIKRYFNPAAMMEKEGATIGGNDAGKAGLVSTTVQSYLKWIAKLWVPLIKELLRRNGYAGGRVELTLPVPEADRTQINLEKVKVGHETGTMTLNEKRELLELPEATPEILAEIETERKNKIASAPNSFGAPSQMPTTFPPTQGTDEATRAFDEAANEATEKGLNKSFKVVHDKEHEPTETELALAAELDAADKAAQKKIEAALNNEK